MAAGTALPAAGTALHRAAAACPRPRRTPPRAQAAPGARGFTYVGLLLAVAISGVLLAGTGVLWRTEGVREREAELLFAGDAFARALESYFLAGPADARRFPRTLQELLEDRRGPVVRRHLRRLYVDPFTGSTDWGVVRAPDGGIVGVYTRHEGVPIKRADHRRAFTFGEARSYRAWEFRARNPAQFAAGALGGAGAPTPAPGKVGGWMPAVPFGPEVGDRGEGLPGNGGSRPQPELVNPPVMEVR